MQLTPFKFHLHRKDFFHLKTAVLIPAYIAHLKGILFFVETTQVETIQKVGYVSVKSNQGHEWLDIPVLENSPISQKDFIDIDVNNEAGDLRLEIIYKPVSIMQGTFPDIYNLKMIFKHD